MSEHHKNITASIQARLTNEARKIAKPYAEILQYYGIERFLYRLYKTRYKNKLLLKGGLLFYSWGIPLRRPTKDIDFLALLRNQKDIITRVISDAISFPVPEDGMNYDLSTLTIQVTQVDADRKGIRANFSGYLGKSKVPIQIDFGFSDEIISEAVQQKYPTLLDGMTGAQIKGYPIESVVAEKFHAIERYAEMPSRWKDFYDIWLISENFSIDDQILQKAIAKTFEIRGAIIPSGRPFSLTTGFASLYREDWKKFLKKSDLENLEISDLPVLIEKIWSFLEWPLQGVLSTNPGRDHRHWEPNARKWKK